MKAGRHLGIYARVACGSLVALAVTAAPASATQLHAFSSHIGSPGSGAGQVSLQTFKKNFHEGSGIAFNASDGDLYLADSGNHRVDVFEPDGTFLRAFGWEVDASSPEAKLQTCTESTGCQAGSPGSEPGQLGRPTLIAADNNPASPSYGDIYVSTGVGVIGQNEQQHLTVQNATGGSFTLTFEGQTTAPIAYNANSDDLFEALGALSTVGPDNVFIGESKSVNGNIQFFHGLGRTNVPQITANASGLSGPGATAEVKTNFDGSPFVPEIISKFDPEGHLIESWGTVGQLSGPPPVATGVGDLASGSATGTGNLVSGSNQVTGLTTDTGAFTVGQGVVGRGLRFNTYITAVGAGTLTLSKNATVTGSGRTLTTNTRFITGVKTGSGAFQAVQQQITGAGIPPDTYIEEVGAEFLALSRSTTSGGTGVGLTASIPFDAYSGMAVAPTGDLWSVDQSRNVNVFNQAGGFADGVLAPREVGVPVRLAVDPAGGYYLPTTPGSVFATGPANIPRGYVVGPGTPTAMALAPSGGDLFVNSGGSEIFDVSSQCEPAVQDTATCTPSQVFGVGSLSEAAGLTVSAAGTLYAADVGNGRVAAFNVTLEANTEAASNVMATSAVLHATIDPKDGEVTTCRFQYGSSTPFGKSLPCLNEADEEVGTVSHPITEPLQLHADASGIEAGTTYHYRLRARNDSEEEIHSEGVEFETLVLPQIEAAEATEINASSATLKAEINPEGLPVTSCEIEWGTSTTYGESLPCEPSSLPAGAEPVPVSAHVTGLQERTTYHWRLVAEDKNGAEVSPDHTFIFLPGPPAAEVGQECGNESLREANASTALPDCRAYELITPPHKNGAVIGSLFPAMPTTVASDGERVLAPTVQCFGGASSCPAVRQFVGSVYEFDRTSSGWKAQPLTPEASQFTASTIVAGSADAPAQLLAVALPATPPAPGREWFYRFGPGGTLSPIGPVASQSGNFLENWDGNSFTGTADLSHLVYGTSPEPLWPSFDPTGGESLYEYADPAEQPFLVAVSGGKESTDLIGTCGSKLVLKERNAALSADGRTVYFEVSPCSTGSGANAGVPVPARAVYARIDGESADARTVKISASAPEPACDSACQAQPAAEARFVGGSADGTQAYFTSTQQLTDEATQGSQNLYLYTDPQETPLTGDHLTDVSAGDTSGQGPQVQGVMAISPDGSHAYFVAKGILSGKNAEGMEPEEGADNLYAFDAKEEKTRFVAALPGACTGEIEEEEKCQKEVTQWIVAGFANVTPDGRYLLFTSRGDLTPDATRKGGPVQVFRYDAKEAKLTRISVGQSGFNDNGNAGSGGAGIAQAASNMIQNNGRPPLNPSMAADGSRVFFESPVGLTPGALDDVPINGRGALAMNIYEWEEAGVAGCAQAQGCVYLISDGHDVTESPISKVTGGISSVELLGADASGENVFFTTADPLVSADADTGRDIYDARVSGGFAPPPQPVPCESSEACHSGGSEQGQQGQPASNGFSGPDEGPQHPYGALGKCPKGKVRRHGKCVKKHHKRKHRNRANRNHGGGK